VDRGPWYGLGAALLVAVGVALYHFSELNTIDPWYLALLVIGTSCMSFAVGWALDNLTGSGSGPGPGTGE
jgi:hypothetical protein